MKETILVKSEKNIKLDESEDLIFVTHENEENSDKSEEKISSPSKIVKNLLYDQDFIESEISTADDDSNHSYINS